MAITAAGKNRIMIFGPKRVSREWKPRLIASMSRAPIGRNKQDYDVLAASV
jgi:hypothetical protein